MSGPSPSHRNPEHDIQLEACDMCGRMVDNRELREYDVQGLRGFRVCGLHKFTGPGPEDLRRVTVPTPPSVEREQPIGAGFWWLDDGLDDDVEVEAP